MLDDPAQRALVRVDARTLAQVGDRLPLGVLSGKFVRSPDGSLLAVGSGSGITFIDPAEMRIRRDVWFKPYPNLAILGWPSERRIFAESCCPEGNSLVVDPNADYVGTRVELPFDAMGAAVLSDAVAYLAAPSKRIAHAQVVLVTPGAASTRYFAPFSRIPAGRHSVAADNEYVLALESHAVKAFTMDGVPRVAIPINGSVQSAQVFEGLAYVWTPQTVTIVDLDAGAVIATLPAPQLSLIGPS